MGNVNSIIYLMFSICDSPSQLGHCCAIGGEPMCPAVKRFKGGTSRDGREKLWNGTSHVRRSVTAELYLISLSTRVPITLFRKVRGVFAHPVRGQYPEVLPGGPFEDNVDGHSLYNMQSGNGKLCLGRFTHLYCMHCRGTNQLQQRDYLSQD